MGSIGTAYTENTPVPSPYCPRQDPPRLRLERRQMVVAMGEVVRFKRFPGQGPKVRRVRRRMRPPPWLPLVILVGAAAAIHFAAEPPAAAIHFAAESPAAAIHSASGSPGAAVAGQAGGDIVGQASVVDGDTIAIRNTLIRFYGIDAPEASQRCTDAAGSSYRCGRDSTIALAGMVRGKTIDCDRKDTDQYGRAVAICTADGVNLNAAMVESGLAVAYRRYSPAYAQNEEHAKQARRGLWAGSFEMPEEYRHRGH